MTVTKCERDDEIDRRLELNKCWLSLLDKPVMTPRGKGVLAQYLGPKYVRVVVGDDEHTTNFHAKDVRP